MKYFILVISLCFFTSPAFADVAYLFNDYKDTPIYLMANLDADQYKKVSNGIINKIAKDGFRPYMIGSDELKKIVKAGQNKVDHYYYVDFTFDNDVMKSSVSCYRKVIIEHKGKKHSYFMPTNVPDVFSERFPEGNASLDNVIMNIKNGIDRLLDEAKKTNVATH